MASISAWQVGTSLTIAYSWSAEANDWWNVDIDYSQIEGSANGATSGSGTYTASSYGTYTVGLYVSKTSGGGEYATASVTLVEPAPPTYVTGEIYEYYDEWSDWVLISSSQFEVGSSFDIDGSRPAYDASTYNYDGAELDGVAVSGYVTVPNSNFWICYYFSRKPPVLTLTLTPTSTTIGASLTNFEDVNYIRELQWTLTRMDTSETFGPYMTYTVAHATSAAYEFTGLIPDKSYLCTCAIYRQSDHQYLTSIAQSTQTTQGSSVYIYVNGSWHQATPYIYSGGAWHEATPNIYSSGWK